MSLFSGDKSPRLVGKGPPGVGFKQRSMPGPSKANGGGRKEPTPSPTGSNRGSPSPPPDAGVEFGGESPEGTGGQNRHRQADLGSEFGDETYGNENDDETAEEAPERPAGKLKAATLLIYMILHNPTIRFLPLLKGHQLPLPLDPISPSLP